MQLKDVSDEGLIQDGSDPTLPVCWRAKFPIRYDSKTQIMIGQATLTILFK